MKTESAYTGTGKTGQPGHRAGLVLALATAPFVLNLIAFALRLPLGVPGRFVYLYSPQEVVPRRLSAVWPFLALAGGFAAAVRLLGAQRRAFRAAGMALAVLSTLLIAGWTYLAPPDHLNQHTFNMHSPSQDGAFLAEAFKIDNLRRYLTEFPDRARLPPEKLRGTRVISNPPATTVLLYGLRRLIENSPRLARWLGQPFDLGDPALTRFRDTATTGRLACWVLTGLWIAAALPLYGLARLFFDPPAALALCVCGLVTPATLLFVPGKDPAQLLTTAVPLWLWFYAVDRRHPVAAALAGSLAVAAAMVSLVHVWLAAVVVVASFGAALSEPAQVRYLARSVLVPAVIGAALTSAALYELCGLNVVNVGWATASAQSSVTRGPGAMPFFQQLLGLPLFAMFCGSASWMSVPILFQRATRFSESTYHTRLGGWLVLCTAAMMLATVGFTNVETPRLWIPLVPLLLLGSWLRARKPAAAGAGHLWAVVLLHVALSALQWCLMDMREAEHRLLRESFFW
jgi:hypothetical protein